MKVDWKARFKALQREVRKERREEREAAARALAWCQCVGDFIKMMDFGQAAKCNETAIKWIQDITDKEAANGNQTDNLPGL